MSLCVRESFHLRFRDLLEIYLIIYLDDLLVFLKTLDEHDSHVLLVLKQLREHGYVISLEGISMDPTKVQIVLEWQTPRLL